ncbi:MAG: MBL fold metallo-hydrolase [Spirochaetaceae bacterium]|nr:MBL fold metallo-hydrolase [Spirochaetaceae bacterium]
MDITFFGAARHVTGSCTLVTCNGISIMIDCGLAQGKDRKDMGDELSFDPALVDILLLTHAHIDHSGRIPQMVKDGFKGQIWSTDATAKLCEIMLEDSAHIQESEIEWVNRKKKRAGKKLEEPLYTIKDAIKSLEFFHTCDYKEVINLSKGISCRFVDAGHLLGSASIELWLLEGDVRRKLVFSGDIGNFDQPIINDPDYLDDADIVIMESTYGDRIHPKPDGAVGSNVPTIVRAKELAGIIKTTFDRGGNVIVPSFAVGRTQEILYLCRYIIDNNLLPEYKNLPVYVDSPLSVKATEIFASSIQGYYDKEAMEIINRGENPIIFSSLTTITDVEQSKELNSILTPKVLISSSGMCDAGRIKHHLKHNLWRPECTILFSGYQANGTLGRSILDGARHVTIFGEQINVKCEITNLNGISGHADQEGLMAWIKSFKKEPKQIFVNHGEAEVAQFFASFIVKELGINAYAPKKFESFSLIDISVLPKQIGAKIPNTKNRQLTEALSALVEGRDGLESVVARLVESSRNISLDENSTNRLINAIERLASDLDYLSDKWGANAPVSTTTVEKK